MLYLQSARKSAKKFIVFVEIEAKRILMKNYSMLRFLLISILFLPFSLLAQLYKQQNFENAVHGLTTITKTIKTVQKKSSYIGQGTAFFYHTYYPEVSSSLVNYKVNSVDSTLKGIWLITNKHVLFSDNYQLKNPPFPDAIEFYLRKRVSQQAPPIWDTLRISKKDLELLVKTHIDSLVDVVAIDVTQWVLPRLLKGDSLYFYSAVSKANFPTYNLSNGFDIRASDDILAVGYPKEFYDTYNLFPTIKAGIIASKWKYKYDGKPFFLIDCKLFPGSSGSIIISRNIRYGGNKPDEEFDFFSFLGIYSGELYRKRETVEFEEMTITRREYYNTGNVWYYYLIEEIIKQQ